MTLLYLLGCVLRSALEMCTPPFDCFLGVGSSPGLYVYLTHLLSHLNSARKIDREISEFGVKKKQGWQRLVSRTSHVGLILV